MSFSTSRFLVVFFMFTLAANFGQASSNDPVSQKVMGFLNTAVQKFLQKYPDATHSITLWPFKGKLENCPQDLQIKSNMAHKPPVGVIRLNVECPGLWKTYVVAEVEVLLPVVLSQQKLNRGDVITAGQLQVQRISMSKLRGRYFTDVQQLEGRQVNRTVPVGRVIQETTLVPQYLVHKGKPVSIQSGNGALFVSMMGVALESGLLDDVIRVRNRSSGKIIDARVVSKNKVMAGL
ncbi:flagellar basal body P-ring formation chaperone FlgA [Endozoicomonas ascidiicola]|uniref:flagellar basal body P-ring formation chaperone FlgA n=1 Tax=Endozoicomonas ascidiicola TaxID=1698521 RepID=UPI00082EE68F|nr:flagellar basal body P-ring formation chaperone FlgA [Endozoicomonas ascidiicola]